MILFFLFIVICRLGLSAVFSFMPRPAARWLRQAFALLLLIAGLVFIGRASPVFEFATAERMVYGSKGIEDCKQAKTGDAVALTYLPENPERYQLAHGIRPDDEPRWVWPLPAVLFYPLIA